MNRNTLNLNTARLLMNFGNLQNILKRYFPKIIKANNQFLQIIFAVGQLSRKLFLQRIPSTLCVIQSIKYTPNNQFTLQPKTILIKTAKLDLFTKNDDCIKFQNEVDILTFLKENQNSKILLTNNPSFAPYSEFYKFDNSDTLYCVFKQNEENENLFIWITGLNSQPFKLKLKNTLTHFCKGIKIILLQKRWQEKKDYDGIGFSGFHFRGIQLNNEIISSF